MLAGMAAVAATWTACGVAEGTARADGEPLAQTVTCDGHGRAVARFPGMSLDRLGGARLFGEYIEPRKSPVGALLARPVSDYDLGDEVISADCYRVTAQPDTQDIRSVTFVIP